MENIKQILDELDDGYKYFAIKKDGCWYKIEFDSFMVKDIERAQNICSELNQMLKNACGGKEVDTGENNALLPDVSTRTCTYCQYRIARNNLPLHEQHQCLRSREIIFIADPDKHTCEYFK